MAKHSPKRRRTRAGRFIRSKGGKRTAAVAAVGVTAAVLAARAARRRRDTALAPGRVALEAIKDPTGFYAGLVTNPGGRAPKSRAGLLGGKIGVAVKRPFRQAGSFLGSIGRTFTGQPTRRRGAARRGRTLLGRAQNLLSFTP